MARISDWLIDPADTQERTVEKLLTVTEVLMRQVEQASGERGAAYEQFRRAALLEDRVRQRTRDLEYALRLLGETNGRLATAKRTAERAQRDLANAIEAVQEGFALFDEADTLRLYNSRFCRDMPDVRQSLRAGMPFSEYVELVSLSAALALPPGQARRDWVAARMQRHHDRQVFNVALAGDRWLQVSAQRINGGGTVMFQTDVTDIIRLERIERGKMLDDQARIIRATLEHINQGVCVFDAGLRLVGWNQRLAQLLDVPAAVLRQGTGFDSLHRRFGHDSVYDEHLSFEALSVWAHGNGPRPPLSFEIRRPSGVILDGFAQETPEGGFVISFSDVTRERLAVQAMLRANASLEARVAARTLDLEAALADAERANASRVRFVAAASHDLLQPLSAAKLFVASVRDDAQNPQTRSPLEKALNALVSVEGILHALLDISRLEVGESAVEVVPVRLAPLLAQLTDEFAPVAAGKGLRLTILPCRLTVASDPAYLRRILQNLIGNAIRYTRTGRVLVGPRRIGGNVRIEVHDTGPGIAREDQQAIFREFHRLDGSASASEGMGLGLAIVERACALLNHRLSLASEPGRGTSFSVEMGLVASRALHPDVMAAIADEPRDGSNRIALLVGSDPDLRRDIGLLLERRAIAVWEVGSGEEALALLDEIGIVPDFYLVDHESDHQSGTGMRCVETVLALRDRHGDRPTCILTADPACGTWAVGIGCMRKPVDAAALDAFLASVASMPARP
ncbi:signal transduction histidine kinase/CheY-like chemotaxis protein [Pseudochelatococcus lubricantis]|uniref:histidine kinase n=1 Tax=Pseudochelatococcus lubricantis TaxID=1538102 RepID=A0ABX0V4S3_9HYPH|nr:PAS-domain containing protein [Pseudochelatococcus lubricantis]NIJ59079.1 signal transduction histidine kinase/CheY-like chemotaxis protein [Pseudochelatococcus lubricantis]